VVIALGLAIVVGLLIPVDRSKDAGAEVPRRSTSR
jgi:hypothetical protein